MFSKFRIIFLIFLISNYYCFSQKTITGIVISKQEHIGLGIQVNDPLVGATILIENKLRNSTISDIDGRFKIKSDVHDKSINITFHGFKSITYDISKINDSVKIEMEIDTISLIEDKRQEAYYKRVNKDIKGCAICRPPSYIGLSYNYLYENLHGFTLYKNSVVPRFENSFIRIREIESRFTFQSNFNKDFVIKGFLSPFTFFSRNVVFEYEFYKIKTNKFIQFQSKYFLSLRHSRLPFLPYLSLGINELNLQKRLAVGAGLFFYSSIAFLRFNEDLSANYNGDFLNFKTTTWINLFGVRFALGLTYQNIFNTNQFDCSLRYLFYYYRKYKKNSDAH